MVTTFIADVAILDGHTLGQSSGVRLVDGRIDAIDVGRPLPGDEVIDGGGATLLPGLIDAHVHLLPGATRHAATFGVTTMLDLFGKPDQLHKWADNDAAFPCVADLLYSSVGATAPGGHPSMMYAPFPTVSGPADARQFVLDRIAEGASFLKIIHDPPAQEQGALAFPSLDAATVTALADHAHGHGLPVVVHAVTAAGARNAVDAGADVLAHVPFEPIDSQLVTDIAARNVAVIATLVTAENAIGSPRMQLADDPDLGRLIGTRWGRVLRQSAHRWRPPEMPDLGDVLDNVGRLTAAGVDVLAGSDAPNPGTIHGASLHRELELLVEAGLNPTQALNAATSTTARIFDLDDRGRVAPGLTADLLLVNGDPTHDITSTRRILRVWRNGIACDLDGYLDSSHEQAGLHELLAQTDRVLQAVREQWPDGAAQWDAEAGPPDLG